MTSGRLAGLLRGLRVDVTPLRESRDFRLLFVAGTVFYLGAMVAYVAVPFQLYRLTGSNFAVGAVALVELVPLVLFGLYGGALADHVDRRRLLVVAGLLQALLISVLMVNAFLDQPRVWLIYVVAAGLAAAESVQRPSKEALEPRTVRHDQIPAATALSGFGMQLGLLAGPAIGGVLVATVGAGWCYLVDVVALVLATGVYALVRPYPHEGETAGPSVRGIVEGISYAARRRDLLGTYLVDIAAMVMALPVVLFPALAQDVFERPELLGLLYSRLAEQLRSLEDVLRERGEEHDRQRHHHRRDVHEVGAEQVAAPGGVGDPLHDAADAGPGGLPLVGVGPHQGVDPGGEDQRDHVDEVAPARSHGRDQHAADRGAGQQAELHAEARQRGRGRDLVVAHRPRLERLLRGALHRLRGGRPGRDT